ncbi:MAG: DUF1501 domain-containing protein [Planctomycetota bacterium]|nr:DUF1501 domain-containing protein [Planctomycetota bacterium]
MLTIFTDRWHRDCDGWSRRDFLRVGALGSGVFGLSGLLEARARAEAAGTPARDTSVVWLWLGGGPTHVETFDPKMTAPIEYRSVTGEVKTRIPGMSLGGNYPLMAREADKLVLVRSFAHRNSGHGGGTHWVMTGYDNRNIDNGGLPTRPSMGSILSRVRGPNHPGSGMPTYVRLGGIGSDGPAFLGTACAPFDPRGNARRDMSLAVPRDRLFDRRTLLDGLDNLNRRIDSSGLMKGLDGFEEQAFRILMGRAPEAFDVRREDPRIIEAYGKGLGQNMLLARRLCEAGCGFVTVHYGGWDMHGNIKKSMDRRGPEMDRAVAAFVQDIYQRGLGEKILLVVTGEFGRTPRVNRGKGRDHWAPLSTLALAGGGLRTGGVVGESSAKAEVPRTTPITPQDLMATVFHVLGLPPNLHFVNPQGRPVFMLEKGSPIRDVL